MKLCPLWNEWRWEKQLRWCKCLSLSCTSCQLASAANTRRSATAQSCTSRKIRVASLGFSKVDTFRFITSVCERQAVWWNGKASHRHERAKWRTMHSLKCCIFKGGNLVAGWLSEKKRGAFETARCCPTNVSQFHKGETCFIPLKMYELGRGATC